MQENSFSAAKETEVQSDVSCPAPDNHHQPLAEGAACLPEPSEQEQPAFILATWRDRLVAGRAFGGEAAAVAVAAHQRVALAGERLVGQRSLAVEAAETVRVVMSVLVGELLQEEGGRLEDGRCHSSKTAPSELRSEVRASHMTHSNISDFLDVSPSWGGVLCGGEHFRWIPRKLIRAESLVTDAQTICS